MPNYLARVAAGARAHSAARPAATAPPMLPDRPQTDAIDPFARGPATMLAAPIGEPLSAPPAKPVQRDENVPDATPAAQPPAQPAVAGPGESPTTRRAPAGTRPPGVAPTFETTVVRAPRMRDGSSSPDPPPAGAAAASPVETVVRAPRALTLDRASQAPAEPSAAPVEPSVSPPAGSARAGINDPARPHEPAIPPTRANPGGPRPPLDAGSLAGFAARPPAQREPRISIGQIDVQVINQPPPVAARPSAPAAQSGTLRAPATGEFEQFRCRLP